MNGYQKDFLPLVVYQIYPRSFCDVNGDGMGDFAGIESKIGYLADLGVNAVWLSPCFRSPKIDNGYDVADFRDTDADYGSLDELKQLFQSFHAHGIKVILDLVANHTSNRHEWFIEARKSKDNPYRNYYYWAKKPLNEWQACFGGSAWEYDEASGEYYLHSYAVEQPDLNWTNPKVRQEVKDVVKFWANLGVDGFRCDVLDQIAKDFSKPDGNGNGEKLDEYIHELFGDEDLRHLFTVGECWGISLEKYRQTCAEEKRELKCSFCFEHMLVGQNGQFEKKPFTFDDFTGKVYEWVAMTKDDLLYPLVLENHDRSRIVSVLGNDKTYRYESATMLATFIYLLKGIPFLYQGQEIGLPNPHYDDISAFDDIETVNYYRAHRGENHADLMQKINFGSRDNGRRMFPWDENVPTNAWLTPHNRHGEINVKRDRASKKSVYAFYQKLLALRKAEQAFIYGDCNVLFSTSGCTAYKREWKGKKFAVICNYAQPTEFDARVVKGGKVVLSNYGVEEIGERLTLRPYEAVVVKCEK